MTRGKIQKIVQDHGAFGKSFRVYEKIPEIPGFAGVLFPAKTQDGLYLVVWSRESGTPFEGLSFTYRDEEGTCTVYPFNFSNYRVLAQFLPHLKPSTFDHRPSFGCGDRLGMVSAAHLEALKEFPVFPVIAQQSP
ncbi:MAG: tagaturonate epimerase family protein, partial [Candidatus Caldatribacteriaceae bacterium]